MQFLPIKTPTPYRLIRILFYLLCGVVTTALLLFFFLKIHQTVTATRGEIITENAPENYLAPFAAEVTEVLVKAGDRVEKGQVLVRLHSAELNAQIAQLTQEMQGYTTQLEHLQQLQQNLQQQRGKRQRSNGNLSRDFSFQQQQTQLELQALRDQVSNQRERVTLARKRLRVEQNMLAEGLISELTYLEKQRQFAQEEQQLTDLTKRYQQQRTQSGQINNSRSGSLNQQSLAVLNVEHQIIQTAQSIAALESQLQQSNQQLSHLSAQRDKATITAKTTGHITQIFNQQRQMDQVAAGTPLLTLTPIASAQFYAKLHLPQTAVKSVKTGQLTQIRLPAYNYHRYGVLQGEILHVDRDTSNQFYALVTIPQQESAIELKNGFSATGKIITDKVRLCTYIYRELLQ